MKVETLPKVTLLIVVRNEKSYISRALDSLLNQTYPKDLIEIIIVDGMSTDGTRELVKEKIRELNKMSIDIKILDNPRYILASGWNIGIKNAKGDIVCRIDTHSEISPNYVDIGVRELLKRKDEKVVCVGGVLENLGEGKLAKAIADLFSSKFGMANSAFRVGIKNPKYTDTAVFGLYWRWIFDKVGYFDENLKRNQDIDLHSKILKEGYKFLTHPEMKAKYYVRSTLKGLIKKAFSDGYWIIASRRGYIRHKIPFLFILYLLAIPVTSIIINDFNLPFLKIFYVPALMYIIASILFGFKDGKGVINKLILPFLFPAFHISYGLGSLKAFLDKFVKWQKKNTGGFNG